MSRPDTKFEGPAEISITMQTRSSHVHSDCRDSFVVNISPVFPSKM
jgi:hypothetical protein